MIMESWNKLHKKRDGKVVAKTVAYLLDQSRWKSYHKIKSYIGLCWEN